MALLGASGGIGQPMALLLKMNPMVSRLALYDLVDTPGVCADVSHVCTPSKVSAHTGLSQLAGALGGADVVIVTAGVPRKPGTGTRASATPPPDLALPIFLVVWPSVMRELVSLQG